MENRRLFFRMADAVTGRIVETADDLVLDHLDLDATLERIDINRLLDRIDVDRVLDRVDVDRVLDRVDLDRVLDRIDIDRLLDRADIRALVARSGVPEIITASTGHMAGSILDVARGQVVGLDSLLGRALERLFRRRTAGVPRAPVTLRSQAPAADGRTRVTGEYAGAVGRALGTLVDVGVVLGTFTMGYAGAAVLLDVFFGLDVEQYRNGPVAGAILVLWAFLLTFTSLVIAGRTPGKWLVGLRVVRRDGTPLSPRCAFIRTLVFPVSVLIAGLGFVPILFDRERRALHDMAAGTAVVYDWGEREARLPGPLSAYLERRASTLQG
jgi:uncharacterized RDD family membrane protein YckC